MLSFAFSQEQIAVTGGSDVSTLRTQARPVPGGWRISGEKIAITLATAAAVALVYAREPGSDGYRGISCFAVPLDVASYLIADGTAGICKRIIATAMLGKVAAS